MLFPLTSRWMIRLLCKCWRPCMVSHNRKRERGNLNGYFKTITPPLKIQSTSTFGYTSLLLYTLHITGPFPLVTMLWWSNQLQIAPSDVIPSQMDVLTKRAPYKMYEIIASSNRWPHLSRPLTSSVTEPPLHNCKRRCKERGTAGEHIQKKKKKMLRRKADYWPDVVNLQITKLQVRIIKLQILHYTVKPGLCVYLFTAMIYKWKYMSKK